MGEADDVDGWVDEWMDVKGTFKNLVLTHMDICFHLFDVLSCDAHFSLSTLPKYCFSDKVFNFHIMFNMST